MIRKRFELVGKRFGSGVVVSEIGIETIKKHSKYPRQYQTWKLQCDCGKEYISSSRYLLYGQGTHCGCLRKKNLLGKRFGSGVVIKYIGSKIRGDTSPRPANVWELQCDCGKIFQTYAEYLTSGCTSSCGCKKLNFHHNYSAKFSSQYFTNIRKDAKRRGHKFELSNKDILQLLDSQGNKCKLSGLPISFDDGSASLDRIDSTKDYTLDNIQWVNRKINYMKNTLGQIEFLSLCFLISDFHRNKGNIDSNGSI